MPIQLNHTIVPARDKHASAGFLAGILGIPTSPDVARFAPLTLGNGVTLDYMDLADDPMRHYAFLVSEDDFDEIFTRVQDAGLSYWADPHHRLPGEINTNDGGRGTYFDDPNGHRLEILTRPYGSGG